MQDGDQRAVFTGDTLFIGGCGRFFEGTPAEMHHALNEVLAELPGDTKVYPGHEYTKTNFLFATTILPHSAAVAATRRFADQNVQTQGHFSIADEKEHNVFMRPLDPAVQKAVGVEDPVGVVGRLRELKDAFKG
ncbi:MAG: Cytoplasmic glyoxalase II [Vezdaea acicularis]|nr:MAG: Cytoplasmic glyoxalase II [Vezdaea acicularis]